MSPHRLARVSETNEDIENDGHHNTDDEQCKEKAQRSQRNANHLHVTINTKPEDMEFSDSSACGNGSAPHSNSRRPSAIIQDILSTRRPSAILAALRSPKQFVNRHREYVTVQLLFSCVFVYACVCVCLGETNNKPFFT